MDKLIVSYLLVSTDFEQHIANIDVERGLNGSLELLHAEIKQKLSEVEGLPEDEIIQCDIKVYAQFNYQ